MFKKKRQDQSGEVARWLLANMDQEELQRLLLREDVPPELWQLLEGGDGEAGIAERVTGSSPFND